MIKLIVTDLDNTLLNDELRITSYSRNILKRCQDEGYYVAFATARARRATKVFAWSSPAAVPPTSKRENTELSQDEVDPDFLIANNGATVWSQNTTISSSCISPGIVEELVSRFLATPEVTYIMIEYGDTCMTNLEKSLWKPDYEVARTDFSSFVGFETPKITIECTKPATAASMVEGLPQIQIYSNQKTPWYQIVASDTDKGFGVQAVSNYIGLSPQGIVCFGDDVNDLAMIDHCGTSVAVSNALEVVRVRADHTCGSNQDDGVARWLEGHLLQ